MVFRKLLFGYFLLMLMLMGWVMINFGRWCPSSNPSLRDSQVFPHANSQLNHDFRMRETELRERSQILDAQELRLKQLETKLIMKYPQEAAAIFSEHEAQAPYIYAITPTYARPVQKAELTRLSQTFLHIRNFHWILIEDSANTTKLVTNLLQRSGLKYTQLNIKTPENYKLADDDPRWLKPRGVYQRNLGLQWIRDHVDPSQKGVIYFADDDNTYDLQIFEEMRNTKTVSVWPVGLVGNLLYERPICANDKVIGFYTYWKPNRPFPMDMAGFAVSLERFFERPEAKFKLRVQRGYQESELLSGLVSREELEPRASNCTKVLVWHTRTEPANLKNEEKLIAKGKKGSDPSIEV